MTRSDDLAERNILARAWRRRAVRWGCFTILSLAVAFLTLAGYAIYALTKHPSAPFDPKSAPPAPDYSQPQAWLAFPGRNGLERSTPPGMTAIDEAQAPADVFFVHPTTFLKNDTWNTAYDISDEAAPLNPAVLLGQIGAFNGCCRLYAPRYRQATLAALSRSVPAVEFAYADVARAFRYYIAHENNGRPFIIASHSQGSAHAIRLLQAEILGTKLRQRLVAAYVIGAYVPSDFAKLGLPVCDTPRQTGCILAWNTVQAGRGPRMLVEDKTYWWQGVEKNRNQPPAICVNPLTWNERDEAPASANPGSLPFPKPLPAQKAIVLPALVLHLTGAACRNNLLEVDIPLFGPSGFQDSLSVLLGSYHVNDYGIFYAAIRRNAVDRVNAWIVAHPRS
ncbi:MAG TPA: DUF3089 domain-containing protein [Rhizomicrobium sp.]|jgi:hypothetical protein